MADFINFEGRVEAVIWGRATYTVLPMPRDVVAALVRAGVMTAWAGLTPGKQRGLLYPINTARTDATRAKRTRNLIAGLMGLIYSAGGRRIRALARRARK